MLRSYFKVGIVTVLILGLCSGVLVQASTVERGSVQVSGSAIVTGTPDVAYITLGVETKDASAEVAAQDNANRMAKVLAALKALGLTDKELTTTGYNVYSSTQVLHRGTADEVTTTTYHVQNRLNIATKDLDGVGQIIDAAVKAGANQVQGVRFDIEDKQEMQLQALQSAVEQAMTKARVMAGSAGIALGGLSTMSESYSSYAPMMSTMALRADGAAGTAINPGDVEVSATVNLNFWF
ncbi:MAG TPA: SIMPL domain-containing protein [Firmicutes bacterium]|nr:SIMPL domain-containing protein [Bacillota bacterium]